MDYSEQIYKSHLVVLDRKNSICKKRLFKVAQAVNSLSSKRLENCNVTIPSGDRLYDHRTTMDIARE